MFFSFVIDVFSRRVVGWQFASNMRTDLVLDALRMALHSRRPAPTSRSSTTPTPARNTPSFDYTQTLDDHGVLARSARSATPTTTRWPRASSTPSRPS